MTASALSSNPIIPQRSLVNGRPKITNGRTISVEFFGPWGCGKSTLAEEARRLLKDSDHTCAAAEQIDEWRRVAGIWSPQSGRMKLTQRAWALLRGSLMHPAVASKVAAQLATAWLTHRGRQAAWAAWKFSILQRAIGAMNKYDVVVWDEGPISVHAATLQRHARFQYTDLITDLCETGYDEHFLFINVTGDIETLIGRQELRWPPKATSAPLSERVVRLKRTLEFMQFVCESLTRIRPSRLLTLDASRPAVLNAELVLQFIDSHLTPAKTPGVDN